MTWKYWSSGVAIFIVSCILMGWGATGGPDWIAHTGGAMLPLLGGLWAMYGALTPKEGETWKTKHEMKKKGKEEARRQNRAIGLRD